MAAVKKAAWPIALGCELGTTPRICIFTETYYPVVGGGETQARLLAQGLVTNGLAAMVVTRRSDAAFKKTEEIDAVTVHRLPPVGRKHLLKWGLLLTSLPTLIGLNRQYDVLFVSGFRVIGISAVIIGKLFNKVCILKADSRGEMSGSFFAGGMEKVGLRSTSSLFRLFIRIRNRILRGASGFVAISTEITNELIDHGIASSRIHRIPNGVDTEEFRPISDAEKPKLRQKLGLPQDQCIVIFTGRLVAYKGLPLLLEVWQRLQDNHQGALLVLVGSGSLDIDNCEEQLKDFVRKHGLQSSVLFTGEVRNVHEYLQVADIFVFPSENEAFGISVVEAMACGLPVISTDSGGLSDIITDQENGLVVEAANFDQLYRALETLLADEQLTKRLGRKARQDAEQSFSKERMTESYIELFDQTLNTC